METTAGSTLASTAGMLRPGDPEKLGVAVKRSTTLVWECFTI
jgi:glycerol kinase